MCVCVFVFMFLDPVQLSLCSQKFAKERKESFSASLVQIQVINRHETVFKYQLLNDAFKHKPYHSWLLCQNKNNDLCFVWNWPETQMTTCPTLTFLTFLVGETTAAAFS